MPERATAYESSQWGLETTLGTPVAAVRRLLLTEVDPDVQANIKPFKPMGIKFNTAVARGKEITAVKMVGDLAYNDVLFQLNCLLQRATITTPANNAQWTVTLTGGALGTFALTFNGQTTSNLVFSASAAAVQAALELLSTVGAGNVVVTGATPTWTVKFIGGLSTTVLPLTVAGGGGGSATSTTVAAATLARRWTYFPTYNGPDVIDYFTLEKGAYGVASFAQQVADFFLAHMAMKFTKDEASVQGDGFGAAAVDPATMTTASVVDISPQPLEPQKVSVWMGSALVGASCVQRLTRCAEVDFEIANKNRPIITLDDSVPSLSGSIEGSPDWTARIGVEHNATAQAILAHMRASETQFLIIESISNTLIETGFPYRFKITFPCKVMSAPKADIEGMYASNFSLVDIYDSSFGGGLKIEVDSPLTALG